MSAAEVVRPRKLVAAALVVDGDRVLVTQRGPNQRHAGEWEFPGGKIESGEDPEQALARELEEEIGMRVEIGRIWEVLSHRYPEFDLLMLVYCCRALPGQTPQCREVAAYKWLPVHRLGELPFLPADLPLLARLDREGVPSFAPGTGSARGRD